MEVVQFDVKQEWSAILEQFNTSSLTVKKFCKQVNISEAQYYYWRRKLQEVDATRSQTMSAFQELTDPSPEGAGLWFDFGNGAKLMVDTGFDQLTLRRLIGALKEC